MTTKPMGLFTQDVSNVIKHGKQFVSSLNSNKNGRYKSWEYCYSAFAGYRNKGLTNVDLTNEDLDFLCLHLSFYLASWGMYRGSSFLLQKDYKVHAPAVEKLMQTEYIPLWAIKCKDYSDENLNKLFLLTNALKEIYAKIRKSANISINREIPAQAISDILITKILMGTLGCVPAYDRYFNYGIKKHEVASTIFNSKSISNLSKYYIKNIDAFENWRHSISHNRIEYPQMKVLDMCFWNIGYNFDKN